MKITEVVFSTSNGKNLVGLILRDLLEYNLR